MLNSYQCYQVLGLHEDASMKEVKAAYRRLALKIHPDRNMSDKDGKGFKLITEAYQTLRSEYKRTIGTRPSNRNYDTENSNKKYDSSSKRYSWGAKTSDKPTEDDWTRYTGYAEDEYQDFWKYYEKAFWEYYQKVSTGRNVDSEPIGVENDISVSVRVDPGRCIACCSCETIAPAVFRVEKNVRINPKSRVINEYGAKSEKILDAAQTCPTKAISVTDKETDRRLYPW